MTKTTKTQSLGLAILAVTALSAPAASVASYVSGVTPTAGTTGAADPTTQGWAANAGSGTTSFSHGLDSTNGGWRITDGTNSRPFFYQATISASDATAMVANDWSATWTVATNADAINSGGGGVDNFYNAPNQSRQNDNAMWIEVTGAFRYILSFKSDANDDLILSDGTTDFQITTTGGQLSEELGTTAPLANYVTFTVTSAGGVVTLSDSLGGNHGAIATNGTATQDRVVWGATSSGGMGSTTWNSINVDVVPEPSTAMLFGSVFVLGLLRRRRRAQ